MQPQRFGLLVIENLAIIAGYVLLGWVGQRIVVADRLVALWPAGGFALAMLLLRGSSRWPAILLGSLLVSELWLLEVGGTSSPRGHAAAILTGVARTLASVAGAWLIRWQTGTRCWPRTVRGAVSFVLISGLIYPAVVAVATHYSMWLSGDAMAAPTSLRGLWAWFIANGTGALVVAPLILVFAAPSTTYPRRSHWEMALFGTLYLVGSFASIELGRWLGSGGLLAYPLVPLMIWAALRFGSRGAAINNLFWATAQIVFALSNSSSAETAQIFFQLQARIVVFSSVILVLAAAIEERQQVREALEEERQSLEKRVAERTGDLARSFSLLHSSLDSTADGLLVVDLQGRITAMNQRFTELWRISPSILAGRDHAQTFAFACEQVADAEAFLSRVAYLREHPEESSEDEIALKDGRVFERFSLPQRMGEEIVGRVWSFRDVTMRRRAEAERDHLLAEESHARQAAEQAFREARQALGLRDEFLAIAAHEMMTPLTSMKMQIQHLERLLGSQSAMGVEPSRLRSALASTSQQQRRLQRLCDQILDLTRLTLGRLELHYERLDLRVLVEEQMGLLAEAASRAGSELRLECASPILGEWDRGRLDQIVCNLISNAIKFGAGSPVTLKLQRQADHVRLQVTDSGIGIAPEDHARIFRRLERAVDSRHYGGLGLGLWIARQSAEALGGSITVESELGKGSTFIVELPRNREAPRIGGTGALLRAREGHGAAAEGG